MSRFSLRYASDVGDGIYTVDTGYIRPQFDACYIVMQRAPSSERIAIIDCGTTHSISRIIATLTDLECQPDQVDYIILTHIHLDHAGGAGHLMQLCPNAQLVVHPRGVKHMIDPTILKAGAKEVYGEEVFAKEYGDFQSVQAHRVIEAKDELMVNLAGRILLCIDTPGHAKHHITIWDQMSHGAFTGDTFGISYREFDTEKGVFIFPSTSPIHFDPKALRASIKKIMSFKPEWIFPTHFSKIGQVQLLYQKLTEMLSRVEDLGKSVIKAEHRHELLKIGLLNLYIQELRDQGCQLSESKIDQLLQMDIDLNAQGMSIWLG